CAPPQSRTFTSYRCTLDSVNALWPHPLLPTQIRMTPSTEPIITSHHQPPLPKPPSWLRDPEVRAWQADLDERMGRVLADDEQGLGFLEEHVEQATLEPRRLALERALQAKADLVPSR